MLCRRRPPPSRLRPPTCSVDAAPTTVRVPITFSSHEPLTSSIGRRPSPSFPSGRAAPSGEPPPSPVTKSGPPPHRPSLRPTTPPHRAAAPLSWPRAERPCGLSRKGLWPSGLGPFQQCCFIFLFRINSKFNSISRKLYKFDKVIISILQFEFKLNLGNKIIK
jgi:hypothetical protein